MSALPSRGASSTRCHPHSSPKGFVGLCSTLASSHGAYLDVRAAHLTLRKLQTLETAYEPGIGVVEMATRSFARCVTEGCWTLLRLVGPVVRRLAL